MNTFLNLSNETVVKAIPDQVCADLNGEVVILNLNSGTYYGLNETGALVWDFIQTPRTIAALQTELISEYDVEPEVCIRDLRVLLKSFIEQNLIEVTDEEELEASK